MSGQTYVTGHVHLQRPAVDADGVVEIDAVEDVFAGQDMSAKGVGDAAAVVPIG